MIQVFELIKNNNHYYKPDYSPDVRSKLLNNNTIVTTIDGWIRESTLFINENGKDTKAVLHAGIIVIVYDAEKECGTNSMSSNTNTVFKSEVICFSSNTRKIMFEIFALEKSSSGKYELRLDYTNNKLKLGKPVRQDYKLSLLTKDAPVRILINGKTDFSLLGGVQRTFNEFDYTITYLGEVANVLFNHVEPTKKTICASELKTINLRKILK